MTRDDMIDAIIIAVQDSSNPDLMDCGSLYEFEKMLFQISYEELELLYRRHCRRGGRP